MIDLDHLKQLNDEHDHQEGDRCLRAVAEIIAAHGLRPGDLAYGGEEFALLLPNADANGCEQLGTRIAEAIRALEFSQDGAPSSWRITTRVGAATSWPDRGSVTKLSTLVEAAKTEPCIHRRTAGATVWS